MTDVSISLPGKRKRGRPRKDGHVFRQGSLLSPENLALLRTERVEVTYPPPDGINNALEVDKMSREGAVDGMVGSMVHGVVEGTFDAGYFISVRIGSNDTPLRGVVFQPRKFVPITAANDVAPQAKMYQRRDIPIPVSGISSPPENATLQPVHAMKQAVVRPVLPSMAPSVTPYSLSNHSAFMAPETVMMRTSSGSNVAGNVTIPDSPNVGVNKQSPSVHPSGTLRMVEQDEVMQAFELSTSSQGSKDNTAIMGDVISESSFKDTTNGLAGKENIGHTPQVHDKNVASGLGQSLNVALHNNFLEGMPQSAFGIQQDEFVRNGLQSPAIELQDIPPAAQVHSGPGQPHSTKTELQSIDLYYNRLRSPDNFHQHLLTNQSQVDSRKCLEAKFHPGDFDDCIAKSPNLNLHLASATHEKKPPQASDQTSMETNYMVLNELKNPNIGYHQALVAGNPLLLPPDLTNEPLEFMLEKHKSPLDSRSPQAGESFRSATGGDSMSRAEAGSQSALYKLELSTPQSTHNRTAGIGKQMNPSDGCITDLDFVLSDVVQPMESHGHQRDLSETKHI